MDRIVDEIVNEAVEAESITDDDPHIATFRLCKIAIGRQYYA